MLELRFQATFLRPHLDNLGNFMYSLQYLLIIPFNFPSLLMIDKIFCCEIISPFLPLSKNLKPDFVLCLALLIFVFNYL